jgi:hypothetical protein
MFTIEGPSSADSAVQISTTYSLRADLISGTFGGFTTARAADGTRAVAVDGFFNVAGNQWDMWLSRGCVGSAAGFPTPTKPCAALSALLGMNIMIRVGLGVTVLTLLTSLALVLEALFVLRVSSTPVVDATAPEAEGGRAAIFAVLDDHAKGLWRWLALSLVVVALALFSYTVTVSAALGYVRDDLLSVTPAVINSPNLLPTFVRPGGAWWVCFGAAVLLAYSSINSYCLAKGISLTAWLVELRFRCAPCLNSCGDAICGICTCACCIRNAESTSTRSSVPQFTTTYQASGGSASFGGAYEVRFKTVESPQAPLTNAPHTFPLAGDWRRSRCWRRPSILKARRESIPFRVRERVRLFF